MDPHGAGQLCRCKAQSHAAIRVPIAPSQCLNQPQKVNYHLTDRLQKFITLFPVSYSRKAEFGQDVVALYVRTIAEPGTVLERFDIEQFRALAGYGRARIAGTNCFSHLRDRTRLLSSSTWLLSQIATSVAAMHQGSLLRTTT